MACKLINGIDIVHITRIEKILDSKKDSFLRRIFTDKEIQLINEKNYKVETIAGLFAGKEATSKALGTGIGKVSFKDIEIFHDQLGKPFLKLSEEVMEEFNIIDLTISISHEKLYAVSSVFGMRKL